MVQRQAGRHELPTEQHVARHCRPRDFGTTGLLLDSAFELRPGEEYLSTNWLEYFHDSDRQSQIAGVQQALVDKGFRVRRTASFAVLNVATSIASCRDILSVAIQFVVLGEAHDPSHTGIYGYTAQDSAVAALLATLVVPNEVYPTTVSPAQET